MTSKDQEPWRGLGEFIKAQRELANLSLRQLSDLADVSNPYLSQVERGLYKPSAEVLKNIAEALHVSAETMFHQAGLLDPASRDAHASGVVESIRLDPNLSSEQKESLISHYKSYIKPA
jgi:transcriptional regulator with XRE-family HTH domain